MNTQTIVHPKLHHYGLITADLDPMVEWYRKVLGMTVNHRSKIPAIARLTHHGPPFSAFAFISNDEMDHRIVFFEYPEPLPIRIGAATPGYSTWPSNARPSTIYWEPTSD